MREIAKESLGINRTDANRGQITSRFLLNLEDKLMKAALFCYKLIEEA